MRILVGHCYEDPSLSPPYAPFVEAVRAYARALPTDELRPQLGPNAADVAVLLPSCRTACEFSHPKPAEARTNAGGCSTPYRSFSGPLPRSDPLR
jgi:hypothetical protein